MFQIYGPPAWNYLKRLAKFRLLGSIPDLMNQVFGVESLRIFVLYNLTGDSDPYAHASENREISDFLKVGN